jgi:hypothetical protein
MSQFLKLTLIFVFGVAVIFTGVELWLKKTFEADVHYNEYVNAYNRVHSLQYNADKLLTEMAAKNELTFDPTNASKLLDVVANLKKPEPGKKPVLILGSSQLIVVNDDWTLYKHRNTVGEVIERDIPELEVYNLSTAIMNYNEKEILLRKLLEVVEFQKVLIFVTPLDLYNDDIRPEIAQLGQLALEDIKARKYQQQELPANEDSLEITTATVSLSNFPVNRELLKIWLKDKVAEYLTVDTTTNKMPMDWEVVVSRPDSLAEFGWSTSEAYSGDHSLYMKNGGTAEFEWSTSNAITLSKPANEITFAINYKTNEIKDCNLCALDFQIIYEDGTVDYYYQDLHFKQGTNDWTQMSKTVKFGQNVITIKPSILFYSGSGELWADDVSAIPSTTTENVLPNPDAEKAQDESRIDTYHYGFEQWDRVTDKGLKVINNLAAEKSKHQFEAAVIVTPIFEGDGKFPYNEALYNVFVNKLKSQCEKENLTFLDATRILEPKNFSIYDSGSKKGLIDIHHFDSQGHQILADFLTKNLF